MTPRSLLVKSRPQRRVSYQPAKRCHWVVGLLLLCTSCTQSSADLKGSAEGENTDLAPITLFSQTGSGTNATSDQDTSFSALADAGAGQYGKLFELLTAEQTGVDFRMQMPDARKFLKEHMLLSVYGGICTGDFDGDGLADFFVTSPVGGGKLYRNRGEFRFEDVTTQVGIDLGDDFWGTGATFVDINNDGRLDLYACGYKSPNRLFINEVDEAGRVKFAERAHEYGLDYRGASMTMAFADIDNDGDLDGYLATTGVPPPPGTKFQVRFQNGKPYVLDHLKEYWELIYLPGDRAHRTEAGQYDHLFRNDGKRFTEITKQSGIDGAYFTLSATWWDYNGDNLPDLYVSNDFLGPDQLYENKGDGVFENVIQQVMPHTPWFSMGSDIGDVDNDGLIDLLATDMSATTHYRDKVMMGNMDDSGWFLEFAEPRQYMRNALYLNTGGDRVREAAFMTGIASTDWTWTPRLADFDNDGDLDLFVTNGALRDTMNSDLADYSTKELVEGSPQWAEFWADKPMYKEKNHAYRNDGQLHFDRTEEPWGLDREGTSFGAATADFDNDGDLDLVVSNADAPVSVYKNNSTDGNRLRVALKGTRSNRFGVGASVTLEVDGQKRVQYLTLSRGWLSSCEPVLHFGLGDAEKVDRITVQWPSGTRQVLEQVKANQLCVVVEPEQDPSDRSAAPIADRPTWFTQTPALEKLQHSEAPFDDFKVQPLLPNRLSRSGPAMAWADVDGDGRPDCYLGGCRGEAGQLWTTGGRSSGFKRTSSHVFSRDAESEDIDALFFDCDGDSDLDLYVVSGSNEAPLEDSSYADRLYLNEGKLGFQRAAEGVLPDARNSGSVVTAADFDGDGDQDLFVGSRCIPGQYPVTPASQLLINQNGKFVDQASESLSTVGLVTDALWADFTGDGQPDLLVATDWGPVKLFANRAGKLEEVTQDAKLDPLTGWWNSLSAGDIDNDGDVDFVATNFGLNTKYKASTEKPELLFYGDVDGSGERHIIEAKFEGDVCYPRRGLSCSSQAMPLIREKANTFHQFAISTLSDLYTDTRLNSSLRLEVVELKSGAFLNDGAGKFTFEPLPRLAQIAPSMSSCLADINADGNLDLILAQNFYGPQRETGHMDGGVGLVLAGKGDGSFLPLAARDSGVRVSGDARRVAVVDLNGDKLLDVVFAVNSGPSAAFLQSPVASLLPLVESASAKGIHEHAPKTE